MDDHSAPIIALIDLEMVGVRYPDGKIYGTVHILGTVSPGELEITEPRGMVCISAPGGWNGIRSCLVDHGYHGAARFAGPETVRWYAFLQGAARKPSCLPISEAEEIALRARLEGHIWERGTRPRKVRSEESYRKRVPIAGKGERTPESSAVMLGRIKELERKAVDGLEGRRLFVAALDELRYRRIRPRLVAAAANRWGFEILPYAVRDVGAGMAPAIKVPMRPVSVSLPAAVVETIDARAKEHQISRQDLLSEVIMAAMDGPEDEQGEVAEGDGEAAGGEVAPSDAGPVEGLPAPETGHFREAEGMPESVHAVADRQAEVMRDAPAVPAPDDGYQALRRFGRWRG